jgi:hypothetical protein
MAVPMLVRKKTYRRNATTTTSSPTATRFTASLSRTSRPSTRRGSAGCTVFLTRLTRSLLIVRDSGTGTLLLPVILAPGGGLVDMPITWRLTE